MSIRRCSSCAGLKTINGMGMLSKVTCPGCKGKGFIEDIEETTDKILSQSLTHEEALKQISEEPNHEKSKEGKVHANKVGKSKTKA